MKTKIRTLPTSTTWTQHDHTLHLNNYDTYGYEVKQRKTKALRNTWTKTGVQKESVGGERQYVSGTLQRTVACCCAQRTSLANVSETTEVGCEEKTGPNLQVTAREKLRANTNEYKYNEYRQ